MKSNRTNIKKNLLITLFGAAPACASPPAVQAGDTTPPVETQAQHDKRMAWFREARDQ